MHGGFLCKSILWKNERSVPQNDRKVLMGWNLTRILGHYKMLDYSSQ